MKRHRNYARWCFLLPGLFVWSSATAAYAAPPADDDFDFEDASGEDGGDDDFDFSDESEGGEAGGDELEIAPESGEGEGDSVEIAADGGDAPAGEGGGDDWGDDDWGDDDELSEDSEFTFEDISEDEEALAEETKGDEVQAEGVTGTVAGVIANAKGEPMDSVTIAAEGTEFQTGSGIDGSYELKLPPGTYTLVFTKDLFKTVTIPDVVVVENEAVTQPVEIVPMAGVMETFVVEDDLNLEAEGALDEARKQKSTVNDGIDASEISKSGGGKVSSVAVRIVGATVVDGRYLFVRGLGHRYGNTLLDGARVPSPEPELRTVPLDVFPSGALSAINVQKTFSPDVPGDFAGGSTQFVTREAPSEPTVSLGVALGANTATTFRNMVTDNGYGASDFFARGNVSRAVPGALPAGQAVGRNALGSDLQPLWSTEEVEAQGEALDTRTTIIRNNNAPGNMSLKATAGNSWSFNDRGGKFGILFSGAYGNKHQTNQELVRLYGLQDGQPFLSQPRVDFNSQRTTNVTNYNGLLKLQLDANSDNRWALTTLYAREARDETRDMYGIAASVTPGVEINSTRQRYTMNGILFTQLAGKHKVQGRTNLEIDYFGSFSQARRDDPAMREMVYLYNAAEDYYVIDASTGPTGSQLFLGLVDNNENAGLNFTVPFKQWKGLDSKFKLGAWLDAKQRTFTARRFDFSYATSIPIPIGRERPINADTIGGGVNAANGGTQPFFLTDRTRPQDSYDAWSRNVAAYASMDLPFVSWFKVTGGLRMESNVIAVQPFDLYDPSADLQDELGIENARLVDLDFLPAASLIFSPKLAEGRGDLNIRLGGSRTLARPEFRELAPFQFTDYVGGFTRTGYNQLRSTKIWNADLRVEWFPRKAEVVALSVFFKQFTDPIEAVIAATDNPAASWANAAGAINGGAELEFRKALDFLAPKTNERAREVLEDLSIGANFAYIYSRVELPPDCDDGPDNDACREEYNVSTSAVRPLQGQSPWIINAYVDYDNSDSGTSARLMYNAFGPYIDQVQGLGLPDIYQRPMHQVDLVASQRLFAYKRNAWGDLRHQLLLDFEVQNLINTRKWRTLGLGDGPVVYQTRDGVGFKLGLTWKY